MGPIDNHLNNIEVLFNKNKGHKHEDNYLKWPLFKETVFARIGYNDNIAVYYSAGIARSEYNGGIRIMSRHTRDRTYNFGSKRDDLNRGLTTLDQSTQYALELGYSDIWLSREESPYLLNYFSNNSTFKWEILQADIKYYKNLTGVQWVMRLKN